MLGEQSGTGRTSVGFSLESGSAVGGFEDWHGAVSISTGTTAQGHGARESV